MADQGIRSSFAWWQLPPDIAARIRPPKRAYTFVANVSGLPTAECLTLARGHELRRGTHDEVEVIREVLWSYLPSGANLVPWEYSKLEDGSLQRMRDKEERWRYFVIDLAESDPLPWVLTNPEIEDALLLAQTELRTAFTVLPNRTFPDLPSCPGTGPSLVLNPGKFFQLMQPRNLFFPPPPVEVTVADAAQIAVIYERLQQHDRRLVDVRRLLAQLHDLESLPSASPLRFLGYFAVLESLLVHVPKPTDPHDSITRQVRKKIALIDHRCQPRIDYRSFGDASPEAVWTKMYRYRSEIAHGGEPSFAGELQVLGHHDAALRLLRDTVRTIIRQALVEPELIVDLREC
jgi:hypothetical protein